MEIIQVTGKRTVNDFFNLPFFIYKDDPNWVAPLKNMQENIFNPKKNGGFKLGDARRWIVKENGKVVGRIAAFYDQKPEVKEELPAGSVGFFESIDDYKVAALLFDTARDWLKSRGFQAMDGPINFGVNFFNWGLLTDGFKQQTFGMQYHPVYYLDLFENYGFRTYYKQFSYRMDISNPDLPERFWKIAAWRAKKPELSFEHFTYKNKAKYIADFIKIHEEAWRNHQNFKPLDYGEIMELIKESKQVLDEEFLWYAYHKGEPVAFFMMIPDMNQVLKLLKTGRLGLSNIFKLVALKNKNTITRCRVIVLGVVPRFQRTGVESGIFLQLKQVMLRKPWYKEMEMSWVGDFNPKMNALFKSFGAMHDITHYTMRYLFDREKPFERMPILKD